MSAPARRAATLLALASLLPIEFARAQDAALGADECKVRWVDGRPMLRATLRAGDKVYYCHLLLDLATETPLFLHGNAAGSLHAQSCDVEIGGITLRDVEFEAKRDTWLEGLTAQFAEELQQVPVAGIVGVGAFGGHDLRLDGPKSLLKLLPQSPATNEPPPDSPSLCTVPLALEPQKGLRVRCELGNGQSADLQLGTREPFGWLKPALAKAAGHADGVLTSARAGATLNFAAYAPFRPEQPEGQGGDGAIGGAVLRQFAFTLQPQTRRIVFELPTAIVYPEIEAAFYRACFGSDEIAPLQKFVAEHGDAPLAAEAAHTLLHRALEHNADAAVIQLAGLAMVKAAPANKKGTAALDVLKELPTDQAAFGMRRAIAEAALTDARTDEDGSAQHKLRLELGAQCRLLGDLTAARRHLLSAVFGMPTSGAANLELGRVHEAKGELDAALGRYFLALLDMKETGQQGYAAFAAAFAKSKPGADLLAELEDRADGRVPAFQPIPRKASEVHKTGRTVLVELFTGAMCPPCAAADVAADALTQLYDRDELVLVQWHLPVPAPEPLVAPVALRRAESREVRATPTLIVAGGAPKAGGGKADQAPDLFRDYRAIVDRELAQPPTVTIDGSLQCTADDVRATATFTTAAGGGEAATWRVHAVLVERLLGFPGRNGILFHHMVARAQLTPDGGAPLPENGALTLEAKLADVAKQLDKQVQKLEDDGPFLVRPTQPVPKELRVVVYVEDAQGAVLQARLLEPAAAAVTR